MTEVATKQDLLRLERELAEIKNIVSGNAPDWVRTAQAMVVLNLKRDALQRLRVEGKIRSKKVGRIRYWNLRTFYDYLETD